MDKLPVDAGAETPIRRSAFLKDVFICALGAYGGPESHFGVFADQLVARRRYLGEEELVELLALCSVLPGPTSTQTIVAVGYKLGGPVLAALTMAVWALPAIVIMGAISFLYGFLEGRDASMGFMRFVGPAALGFILVAALRIGRKVVTDRLTAALMLAGATFCYFVRAPWAFPAALLAGGAITFAAGAGKRTWVGLELRPPWGYLAAFGLLAVAAVVLGAATGSPLARLFEAFYRFGYLVFGGGQVVVPLMHGELVGLHGYLSHEEFMTGYGLVQAVPGPMFSFAAYAGGMATRGGGALYQAAGAAVAGASIFLPGILLIFFVYPIWNGLKKLEAIKAALRGIGAVAGGLMALAAVILAQADGFRPSTLAAAALSAAAMASGRIPAPLIVAAALAAGFLIP